MLQNGKTVEDIKVEAFAVVREAAKRVLGLRHYDVQLIGGLVLLEGNIAEMPTGKEKLSFPLYLRTYVLSKKGVHVITVNDYLAKRDKELIGRVHEFLGLTVGLNMSQMESIDKNALMKLILHTESVLSLVSIIFVIIWHHLKPNKYSAHFTLQLLMRLIAF